MLIRHRLKQMPHRNLVLAAVTTALVASVIFVISLSSSGRSNPDITVVDGSVSPGLVASADASESPSASPSPSLSPSPSVSPSPKPPAMAPICPAFPQFPGAGCTGWKHTGVKLHDCEGFIEASNVTFDSCYFPKGVTAKGANITIKRSQVHGTISAHWSNNLDFKNLVLIDVEVEEATNMNPDRAAIGGHNFSCLRCDVHHTGTGIHVGNNATVTDSWTHDFIMTPGAHGAGMGEGQGHGNNSKIIHNNIECNRLPGQEQVCSSALSLYDEPTLDNVLVQNNLFNTVGGYCTYGGGADGTNIRYIDNRFGKKYHSGCGQYGPVAAFFAGSKGNVWSGNAWQDGSGPVNPKSGV